MKPLRATTTGLILTVALLGAWAQPRVAQAGLVTIATTGAAAPGGGTFGTHFGVPVINNSGQVAVTVFNSGVTDPVAGVYQGTSSTDLAAVARLGGSITTFGHTVAQNDGGVVVFAVNSNTGIVSANPGSSPQFVKNAGDVIEPIAGGTKFTLSSVSDPVINDNGQVAYTFNGTTGVIAGGKTMAFAGEGDLLNGQVFTIDSLVSLDNSGDVAFGATASYQGPPFADIQTIATSSVSSAIVDFALLSGLTLNSGETIAINFSGINGTSTPMISNAGIVFRSAACAGFTCDGDVFLLQGNTLTVLAKSGDAAPGGGTFSTFVNSSNYLVFDEPQINDNGSIVFVGATDGGPGSGVYRFTQAHGLEAMALQGQGPYAAAAGFRNAVINNHDVVAFQAFDGSAGNHRGVYITDGTTTVRAGSDNFFGNEGSSTGAFSRAFFGSQAEGLSPLNDHSEVTFVTGDTVNGESVLKFSVDPSWAQPGGGLWDVAGNWKLSVIPTIDSIVTIGGQVVGPVVVTGPAAATTVASVDVGVFGQDIIELDLQSGGPLTCTGRFRVDSNGVLGGVGTLTASRLDVFNGGNSPLNGKVTGTLTLNAPVFNYGIMDGDFIFNGDVTNELGGSIKGNHTFNGNLINLGTISPGHSPGTVTVNGDLTLQSMTDQGVLTGSDLEIEIGGPNPADYDVINVTGHATLAGKLHVIFINGFTPIAGQTFHILNAGSVSGSFDVVTGAVVTSTQGGLDIAPPGTVTSTPKALVKCGAAITKAGGGFTAARLKALDACVGGIFKCVQETDAGAKRDACVAKANTACGKDLTKIAGLGTKLTGVIDKACGAVGAADVLAPTGVGYQDVATDCANQFATTLDTLASIEHCILGVHACRGETILDAQVPRAKELMRVAGVATVDLDALACLPDNLGTGADLGAPKGAGKAVTGCAAALTKAGDTFAAKQQKSLAGCVGAVYACATEKPGDAACLTKAHATCDKAFAAIDTAMTAFENAVAKACAPPALDFTTGLSDPAGANVGVLATDCAALGVASLAAPADYVTCLARREACNVEDLVRFEAPRANELLGLVGRSLVAPFCPAS